MTDEAMSPLRRRMIEDMSMRRLAPKTQKDYIQVIKNLAVFIGRSPDTASFEDIRRFQLQVGASGVGAGAINRNVSALRFFFRVTLKRYAIVEHTHLIHEPRKLPVVLNPEEVVRLLDAARAQVQGGAERGLWRGTTRRRSRRTQGLRYRQQAHADPSGAGQGSQGPQRHAVSTPARSAACVVEGSATTRLGPIAVAQRLASPRQSSVASSAAIKSP